MPNDHRDSLTLDAHEAASFYSNFPLEFAELPGSAIVTRITSAPIMDDFPASVGGYRREPEPDNVSIDSDREGIYADNDNPTQIVTFAPRERFKLGLFDCICLILNRTIGTGIFNSPQRVMKGTGSTGASLLMWLLGSVYCISGTHVYMEYGLNIPRYSIGGVEQSVPRSGGDLNYLSYVYRQPRKDSVLLSTCLFSIAFISLGNMAGNCISFSIRVLNAADFENPSSGLVRGIALAIAAATCLIHAFSRRGGIWLNNLFAMIKLMILFFILIVAIVVSAGGLPKARNVFTENTKASASFSGASEDANGYAHAFLAIIFSFSGYEQVNYVMGEVGRPRRKYPIAMMSGVTIIIVLYMAINLAYMAVVPKELQLHGKGGVAQQFFELSIGTISNDKTGRRIFNAFLAISSLGNIIVMTYTAARVKQEIAKEGIIPFAKFFAQNKDLSLGRLLRWFHRRGHFSFLMRLKWLAPEEHSDKTPVGALVLHLLSCIILILATWGLEPDTAYTLLTSLSSYLINAFSGTFLALGILILRIRGISASNMIGADEGEPKARKSWASISRFNPGMSVACALIYMVGNLFPVVTTWIKPNGELDSPDSPYEYWLPPTICWAVIGVGIGWFLGFVIVAWRIDRKHHKVFVVEKRPEFEAVGAGSSRAEKGGKDRNDGGLVLVHETVYLSWVGRETLRARRTERVSYGGTEQTTSSGAMLKGTDFDGFYVAQQQEQQQQFQQQQYQEQHFQQQQYREQQFQQRQYQQDQHFGGFNVYQSQQHHDFIGRR
ncbi:High-affinity methionine permease [Paramyrothecium foliicola]|nr:High-affinity methionine permease [Paramyrothecium foliicola]